MKARLQWAWSWLAFKAWLWLPSAHYPFETPYGRFSMWLLGHGGIVFGWKDFETFRAERSLD